MKKFIIVIKDDPGYDPTDALYWSIEHTSKEDIVSICEQNKVIDIQASELLKEREKEFYKVMGQIPEKPYFVSKKWNLDEIIKSSKTEYTKIQKDHLARIKKWRQDCDLWTSKFKEFITDPYRNLLASKSKLVPFSDFTIDDIYEFSDEFWEYLKKENS